MCNIFWNLKNGIKYRLGLGDYSFCIYEWMRPFFESMGDIGGSSRIISKADYQERFYVTVDI